MAMTMRMVRVRKTCRAVGKGPGNGREQRTGRGMRMGMGMDTVQGKIFDARTPGGDDVSRAIALQCQKQIAEAD